MDCLKKPSIYDIELDLGLNMEYLILKRMVDQNEENTLVMVDVFKLELDE